MPEFNVCPPQDYRGFILSLAINQKLGICHALLELGDWAGAYDLMKLLPPFLTTWCPDIVRMLCELISHSIEPIYRR
jgi:THO complex subunit 2